MSRSWQRFDEYDRKKAYVVLKRNMNVKGDFVGDSGVKRMMEKAFVVLKNT